MNEDRNAILKKLFGDFESLDFEEKNIVQLDLAGDKELDFRWPSGARILYLEVNKVIVENLRRALKKVHSFCDESGYVIYAMTAFKYRYKEPWGSENKADAVKDRKSGKQKDRLHKMSNHALGTAVDINAGQNAQHATKWDMPAEIVKIMREEGFYWGGNYRDAMHFEYKLPYVNTSKWFFPFAPESKRVSPLNYLEKMWNGLNCRK